MSAPYRTSEATLRAEVERLTRELATAREQRARRWQVERDGSVWCFSASASMFVGCCVAGGWAAAFVAEGWTATTQRGALVLIVAAALWALAFVRRVPVDGGGE